MAPSYGSMDDSAHAKNNRIEKMPPLPKHARVHKRPLLHPQISSPYAGRGSKKVVYVSSKTPFMSAIKRVQQLLDRIRKRSVQADLSRQKQSRSHRETAALSTTEPECVLISATGKAIDKALSLALFLQNQTGTKVKIATTSADAIDDIVSHDEPLSRVAKDGVIDSSAGGADLDGDVDMARESASKMAPEYDFPESRIRHASVIQVLVTTQ